MAAFAQPGASRRVAGTAEELGLRALVQQSLLAAKGLPGPVDRFWLIICIFLLWE